MPTPRPNIAMTIEELITKKVQLSTLLNGIAAVNIANMTIDQRIEIGVQQSEARRELHMVDWEIRKYEEALS